MNMVLVIFPPYSGNLLYTRLKSQYRREPFPQKSSLLVSPSEGRPTPCGNQMVLMTRARPEIIKLI